MGQAILDLPDPTQLSGVNSGPLSPEALASADDLLSQLAGDDIDRLLAEAEAETPRPAALTPPEPAVAASASQTVLEDTTASTASTEAAIDAILAPAIDSTLKAVDEHIAALVAAVEIPPVDLLPTVEVAPAPAIEPQTPPLENLDQKLLDEAAAHVSAIMDPPPAPPEPVAPAPVAPATIASSSVADSAERQALSAPLVIPSAAPPSSNRVSLLVKILQWINSPMLLFSDAVREAIGKVAILTTFNAAAVIVYVMVFRRPHH